MTTQLKTASFSAHRSRWRRARTWLTAIDEAIAYDPQEEVDEIIRGLRKSVTQLETKVAALERSDNVELRPVTANAIA